MGMNFLKGCISRTRSKDRRHSPPADNVTGLDETYQWTRLTDQNDIRLLVLKPGLPEHDIECDVRHVRLSDNPNFEAISYAWESEALPRTIYCDGKPLHITENLFRALWSFRSPTSTCSLWVDAISINQRDLVEKAEQVRMMGTIFKTATRVRVWLGNSTPEIALAFKCIEYGANEPERYNMVSILSRDNIYFPAEVTTGLRKAMLALFCRKYFTRLWIVQEVAQASQIEMICGSLSMPFETMIAGLQQLTTDFAISLLDSEVADSIESAAAAGSVFFPPSVGLRTLKIMHQFRTEYTEEKGINIARLLATTRHCQVTDPRDRVFALLSLSDNFRLQKPFPIDYTLSAADMFARLAEWYYTVHGLGFMSYAIAPSVRSELKMPSWAPNWVDATTSRPLWDYTKGIFTAGGRGRHSTGYVGPKDVLNVNGKYVDEVADIIEHPASRPSRSDIPRDDGDRLLAETVARANFYDDTRTLAGRLWDGPDDGDFSPSQFDTYWRTLVANTHFEGKSLALPSDADAYLASNELIHLTQDQRRERIFHAARTATSRIVTFPPREVAEFEDVHETVAKGRVFISSQERRDIGWAPYGTRRGDMIVVFEGGEIPFVIRAVEGRDDCFELVGECYLHGIMAGEAWDDGGLKEGLFRLV